MKHYTFERGSQKFDDILKDPTLKSKIYEVITWQGHIRISIDDSDNKLASYIMLKYGDDIRTNLTKDYSPKPNIDYTPKRDK